MIARLFYKHAPTFPASQGHRRCKNAIFSMFVIGLLIVGPVYAVIAQEEPSPIDVELVVPQQAGPGQLIDVVIKYNATDLNAGAVLNYNMSGPGVIQTRTPEPPNPIVNTWGPKFDPAQGSIKIQIQLDQGTDGQTLQHLVEVKWGSKFKKFEATTQIKYVPPTATPTQPPRPTATRPAATATPTPLSPAQPTWNLASAVFVAPDGTGVLPGAVPNQEVALEIRYSSSQDAAEVTVEIQFEPDVVNLDGAERTTSGYVIRLANVPAAVDGLLFDPPLHGRMRFYEEGQDAYTLQAVVQVDIPTGGFAVDVAQAETGPLQVTQPPAASGMVTVEASVDSGIIRPGGNIIVHARCINSASSPVVGVRLVVVGLADGFSIVPEEHVLETVAAGETVERVFTIRAPDDLRDGPAFRIAATAGEKTIESAPISLAISRPVELNIQAVADRTQIRAGDAARVVVTVENKGDQAIENAAVRLIDTTGNLGVLLQNSSQLGPGATQDLIFAVQVPAEFPADIVSSLVAQVTAADGTIAESAPISLEVACVPNFELVVQAPTDTLRAGKSAEMIVTLRNISQCKARDVAVGVGELPASFTPPAEVRIAELAPGESRQLTFNLLIPEKQPAGGVNMMVSATAAGVGVQRTAPTGFMVGGVSVFFTVVFALLVLVAIGAIVAGTVLYFRQR